MEKEIYETLRCIQRHAIDAQTELDVTLRANYAVSAYGWHTGKTRWTALNYPRLAMITIYPWSDCGEIARDVLTKWSEANV